MMDFGTFDGFWRWLAQARLNAQEEIPIQRILARVLGAWRTCVVCNLLWERAFDLASGWQYVLAEDPAWQAQFVEGQTWCNRHAWFFKEVASPRTRGRLHRQLYTRLEARIGDLLRGDLAGLTGQGVDQVLQDLIGDRVCPLCHDEAAFRELLLTELARGLASGSLRSAFAASAGCCLPHLAALLHVVPDGDTGRFLLETTLDLLQRLTKDLGTYEEETENYQRRYGSAADAPTRAMVCWAGLRGIVQGPDCAERVPAFEGGTD